MKKKEEEKKKEKNVAQNRDSWKKAVAQAGNLYRL